MRTLNTAAHQALAYAVATNECIGRRGAPQATLFSVLRDDLSCRNLHFEAFEGLNELRDIASCSFCWRNLF